MNQAAKQQSTQVFYCVEPQCGNTFEGPTKFMARHGARERGWIMLNMAGEKYYRCPQCEAARLERTKERRAESLKVYSSEEDPEEADRNKRMNDSEERRRAAESRFERYFGPILSGDQMGACVRLRNALDVVQISGNAAMSYDGVGIDSLSFGSKTIQDVVLAAQDYKRRCEMAVVAGVQMEHHDAWKVFVLAIEQDLPPQETGDFINRLRNDRMNEKKRRKLGVSIVEKSSTAILAISY